MLSKKPQNNQAKPPKTSPQYNPRLYPDKVNKLHFDLLFISEIHVDCVKENYKPRVNHIKDTFLDPQERKILMTISGTGSGAPAGKELLPLALGSWRSHFANPWHRTKGLKSPVKMDKRKLTSGDFYFCEITSFFNSLSLLAKEVPWFNYVTANNTHLCNYLLRAAGFVHCKAVTTKYYKNTLEKRREITVLNSIWLTHTEGRTKHLNPWSGLLCELHWLGA